MVIERGDIAAAPSQGMYALWSGMDLRYTTPAQSPLCFRIFFYMPSRTSNKNEDQYLLFWNHEQAIATESGVEYLSPPQKELYLIKAPEGTASH